MEAVLAAFMIWPPECAHCIARPAPIRKAWPAGGLVSSLSGEIGHLGGPSAGASSRNSLTLTRQACE